MKVPGTGTRPVTARCQEKKIRKLPMRSGCLWLLGVPLPIILLLWLITGHA